MHMAGKKTRSKNVRKGAGAEAKPTEVPEQELERPSWVAEPIEPQEAPRTPKPRVAKKELRKKTEAPAPEKRVEREKTGPQKQEPKKQAPEKPEPQKQEAEKQEPKKEGSKKPLALIVPRKEEEPEPLPEEKPGPAPEKEPEPVIEKEEVSEPALEAEKEPLVEKEGREEIAEAVPMPLPPAGRGEAGGLMKGFAVLALLCTAIFLAYYFISLPENSFVPGAKVDSETFKGIFLNANSVYIVMDVRGAGNNVVSNNILQCGVDFAASSGMGGKTVTPLSFGSEGCTAPDGQHPPKDCFAMLKNGITVYVKEGTGEVGYYANGMVVSVGPEYTQGTCAIKRT